MAAPLTPSQTVGPFFHDGLLRDAGTHVVAGASVAGERVAIVGRVLDGQGEPVDDALVEVWQANPHGRYHHPADTRDLPLEEGFTGFGRSGTDDDGTFRFETVVPGPVPHPDGGEQAPHLLVTVQARGMLDRVVTRMYFPDHPANGSDPVLASVPAERRRTLIATREDGDGTRYRFDIHLQGSAETVFFET